MAISRQSGGFERSGAPEICGDSPRKKWRFWKPGGRRQIVAILGKKVAILSKYLAIFRNFYLSETTGKTFISIQLKYSNFYPQKSGDFGANFAPKHRVTKIVALNRAEANERYFEIPAALSFVIASLLCTVKRSH